MPTTSVARADIDNPVVLKLLDGIPKDKISAAHPGVKIKE
jgi:hypothetical protein